MSDSSREKSYFNKLDHPPRISVRDIIRNSVISDVERQIVTQLLYWQLSSWHVITKTVCVKSSLIDDHLFIVFNIKWCSASHYEKEAFSESEYRFRKVFIFVDTFRFDSGISKLTSRFGHNSVKNRTYSIFFTTFAQYRNIAYVDLSVIVKWTDKNW